MRKGVRREVTAPRRGVARARVNEVKVPRRGVARVAILLAFGLGTIGGALATPQSFNYKGTPLLTGGVSEEEREAMRRDLGAYNIWLVFV